MRENMLLSAHYPRAKPLALKQYVTETTAELSPGTLGKHATTAQTTWCDDNMLFGLRQLAQVLG